MIYRTCEWCGKTTNGEMLCDICERHQVWAIKEHTNEQQGFPLEIGGTQGGAQNAQRVMLPKSHCAPELSDWKRARTLGGFAAIRRRRDSLDRLRKLRKKHGAGERVIYWPQA